MTRFNAGLSALQTSQRVLEMLGNNVSNANTPGYHRQVSRLTTALPNQIGNISIGNGVSLQDISRIRAFVLEQAILRNSSEAGNTDTQLTTLRRVESQLGTGVGSLGDRIEGLFNHFEELSAHLNDNSLRNVVANEADGLTDEFNRLADELGRLTRGLDERLTLSVQQVNSLTTQIARLNREIQRMENRGADVNDVRDQRDQLINDLADLMNVEVEEEQRPGQTSVNGGGFPLVVGGRNITLRLETSPNEGARILADDFDDPLSPTGGELSGLLQLRNDNVPNVHNRLDDLATGLIRAIDPIHVTGIGITGPLDQIESQRGVEDVTATLADSELTFPVSRGSVFIGVTDQATGTRTLEEVAIDPVVDSLDDVAASFNAVPNVQAVTNAQSGALTLLAGGGFGFDFTGGLTAPDVTNLTAATTSVASFGGSVTTLSNDEFTVTFAGSGTVGITTGLDIQVRDQGGNLIATRNVGSGYEPDSEIEIGSGVTVSLSSGDVTAGESVSVRVIGDPDEAGLLTGLGLNSFFTGRDALTIGINPDLIEDPSLIATSRSREVEDSFNVQRIVAQRDVELLAEGEQTFREFHIDTLIQLGARIERLAEDQQTEQVLGERLELERQGLSGVDPNEELVKMLQFQRMFQIAANQISVVNEAFDSLLAIV